MIGINAVALNSPSYVQVRFMVRLQRSSNVIR